MVCLLWDRGQQPEGERSDSIWGQLRARIVHERDELLVLRRSKDLLIANDLVTVIDAVDGDDYVVARRDIDDLANYGAVFQRGHKQARNREQPSISRAFCPRSPAQFGFSTLAEPQGATLRACWLCAADLLPPERLAG